MRRVRAGIFPPKRETRSGREKGAMGRAMRRGRELFATRRAGRWFWSERALAGVGGRVVGAVRPARLR
jgi:hypothetical protein